MFLLAYWKQNIFSVSSERIHLLMVIVSPGPRTEEILLLFFSVSDPFFMNV